MKFLFPESEILGATIPTIDPIRAFILEIILTFILMLTIINVSTGSKEVGIVAGIAIGGVVLLEAMFAGPVTNASMNPVRSLAPAIASGKLEHIWLYLRSYERLHLRVFWNICFDFLWNRSNDHQ